MQFMWRRAMATAALQGKVQTARARCILSAVIIASLLMCSEDAECQVASLSDQKINNEKRGLVVQTVSANLNTENLCQVSGQPAPS